MSWVGAAAAGVIATGVGLAAGALWLNRVGLTAPPGVGVRLGVYLSRNWAETGEEEPFPELRTPEVIAPPLAVRAQLEVAMRGLGWEQIRADGMELRAVVVTPLVGFRDDLRVRIDPAPGGGSRLHIRSASRVGRADFGANRRHVLDLLTQLERVSARVPSGEGHEGGRGSPGRSP